MFNQILDTNGGSRVNLSFPVYSVSQFVGGNVKLILMFSCHTALKRNPITVIF